MICGHCGGPLRGYATLGNIKLCHPDEGMDCYRLVTLYGHGAPCVIQPCYEPKPELRAAHRDHQRRRGVTRSLRHRLARRGRSPYVWLPIPVISPYADRLQQAAFPGGCVYLVLPSGGAP
jgi:hypothetical protein